MNESQRIFKEAVKMAKSFTGNWIARMKLALKILWKRTRKHLENLAKSIEKDFAFDGIFITARVWEKYGKRRIYVNSGRLSVGYFDFDEEGHYNKAWIEFSDWDCGKTSQEMKYQKQLFANGVEC